MSRHPRLAQHHPQRDQPKCAQPLNRQQRPEQLPSEIIREFGRKRHAQKKTHLRRIKRADVPFLHRRNLISERHPVKAYSSVLFPLVLVLACLAIASERRRVLVIDFCSFSASASLSPVFTMFHSPGLFMAILCPIFLPQMKIILDLSLVEHINQCSYCQISKYQNMDN